MSNPNIALRHFISKMKCVLFLQSHVSQSERELLQEIPQLTASDGLLVCLFLVMHLYRNFMGFCTDSMILMACLTLWYRARQVAETASRQLSVQQCHFFHLAFFCSSTTESMQKESLRKSQKEEVLQQYRGLKELSKLLNGAMSHLFLSFILEGILLYSITVKSILIQESLASVLYLSFFFASFAIVIYFAADVCHQVKGSKLVVSC
jgi:hypothetical protein